MEEIKEIIKELIREIRGIKIELNGIREELIRIQEAIIDNSIPHIPQPRIFNITKPVIKETIKDKFLKLSETVSQLLPKEKIKWNDKNEDKNNIPNNR